jgi:CheY-like chemotaxis protein
MVQLNQRIHGLLAGRKLLLADDSVTIQKVIELTFADEGVSVVTFGNGQDAIDKLEEEAPDVVLADVFMPGKSGYEVCEYVKQNEKLQHIPVMLLVGSFEPFDEAEARRVGADDILTKPFQSIRRLIDRVGALVTSPPPVEKEVPTAELPRAEDESSAEETLLNSEELAMTTADTMPLPNELHQRMELSQPLTANENELGEKTMDTGISEVNQSAAEESSDVLLDLGEFEPARADDEDDEFVLDLDSSDLEEVSAPTPIRAFVEPQVTETVASVVATNGFSYQTEVHAPTYSRAEEVAYEDQVHEVPEQRYSSSQQTYKVDPEPTVVEAPPAPSGATSISPESLSPQMIDAIARRVVELMSDKVVREVAWEVVPDLAELLIKKQLEESQRK